MGRGRLTLAASDFVVDCLGRIHRNRARVEPGTFGLDMLAYAALAIPCGAQVPIQDAAAPSISAPLNPGKSASGVQGLQATGKPSAFQRLFRNRSTAGAGAEASQKLAADTSASPGHEAPSPAAPAGPAGNSGSGPADPGSSAGSVNQLEPGPRPETGHMGAGSAPVPQALGRRVLKFDLPLEPDPGPAQALPLPPLAVGGMLSPMSERASEGSEAATPGVGRSAHSRGGTPSEGGGAGGSMHGGPGYHRKVVDVIQRSFHFAVEVWPGPSDSVFRHTKVGAGGSSCDSMCVQTR